jgi:hypothetical protein
VFFRLKHISIVAHYHYPNQTLGEYLQSVIVVILCVVIRIVRTVFKVFKVGRTYQIDTNADTKDALRTPKNSQQTETVQSAIPDEYQIPIRLL